MTTERYAAASRTDEVTNAGRCSAGHAVRCGGYTGSARK